MVDVASLRHSLYPQRTPVSRQAVLTRGAARISYPVWQRFLTGRFHDGRKRFPIHGVRKLRLRCVEYRNGLIFGHGARRCSALHRAHGLSGGRKGNPGCAAGDRRSERAGFPSGRTCAGTRWPPGCHREGDGCTGGCRLSRPAPCAGAGAGHLIAGGLAAPATAGPAVCVCRGTDGSRSAGHDRMAVAGHGTRGRSDRAGRTVDIPQRAAGPAPRTPEHERADGDRRDRCIPDRTVAGSGHGDGALRHCGADRGAGGGPRAQRGAQPARPHARPGVGPPAGRSLAGDAGRGGAARRATARTSGGTHTTGRTGRSRQRCGQSGSGHRREHSCGQSGRRPGFRRHRQ